MSRLDRFIERMSAQRDGLAWAFRRIDGVAGDALEIGLGSGRSYDHLRAHLPGRRIWVIERGVETPPELTPPEADLLLGEADDGLARLAGAGLALIHYDLGVGDVPNDRAEAARLAPAMAAALGPGGVIVSTQPLPSGVGLDPVPEAETGRMANGWFYVRRRLP